MSLLDERELTDEERVAIADEPRPGVWIEEHEVFHKVRAPLSQTTGKHIEVKSEIERRGDGRALSQDYTDTLIATELYFASATDGYDPGNAELLDIIGEPMDVVLMDVPVNKARQQRGGIHSDPLVRLLAFRAWGDRDRTWFAPKKDDRALGAAVVKDHPDVTAARLRALVKDVAGRSGASIGEVLRDFRRINTNPEVTPTLDEMEREWTEEQRRRDEVDRRAREFFRRR